MSVNSLDDARFEGICNSMEQNREEIEEALLLLASEDEQHRRLTDLKDHAVTSFEIGSDMVSYFDCYCDQSNPGNNGCARRTLAFAEVVADSITQEVHEIGENPAELLLKV